MIITDKLLTINPYSRPGYKLKKVKGIVVHWVANTNTTALANRNFFENRKYGKMGYGATHYIINLDGQIIRCIPENEVAYHVGAKTYKKEALRKLTNNPNAYTIGIECTHIKHTGEMSIKTLEHLRFLCSDLLKRYQLNKDKDLYLHFDITGKICHKWFVDNPEEWKNFKRWLT
jgi:N-acetylmuramoyl-L-alanine amidase